MGTYQIYKEPNLGEQSWKWTLLDEQSKNLAYSSQPLLKDKIVDSIKSLREKAQNAEILQKGNKKERGYSFEYFLDDKTKTWKWIFGIHEKEVSAFGKEYEFEDEIKDDLINNIKKEMSTSKITWQNPKDDPSYQDKKDDHTPTKGIPGSLRWN